VSDTSNTVSRPDWDRLQLWAVVSIVAGVVLFVALSLVRYFVEGIHDFRQLFISYLVGYIFWLGVPLGGLVLVMMQYLTGGAWAVAMRRVLDAGSRTLWLLLILFLPVAGSLLLGTQSPYTWAWPSTDVPEELHEALQEKAHYLDVPFFLVRAAVCFVAWLLLVFFLHRWSVAGRRLWAVRLSGPGLVVFGITVTVASVDWVMSLEPTWYSTIYSALFAMGEILTALAVSTCVVLLLAGEGEPLAGRVRPEVMRDIGSLLLTFVMLWAYMSFSQFLLIWVGNLPEEIPWYLRRSRDGWQWVAICLAVLHFALPLLLLLFRDVKEHRRALLTVAGGLLVIRFVDVLWWIEPAVTHEGDYLFWLLDIAAAVTLGGVWAWGFLALLRKQPLQLFDETACAPVEENHA